MIHGTNITKRFGNTIALDSLSCHIQKGEIFGIVGPDGSGKSTLLRILSTIVDPDEGTILINGKNTETDSVIIKENLAYMPQRFGLYEDLTVEENIFFFGKIFSVPKKEIKIKLPVLYNFSRLEPFKDRLAGKLSGGMKQKLGLACCLVHTPELILLDEPTNGVDPVSRREFWKILYDLLGQGVTIVVSTAYLDEAERCNRIALLYDGTIIKEGNPKDIRKNHGTEMIQILTDNPRKSEHYLKEYPEHIEIIRSGTTLRVFTPSPEKHKRSLSKYLKTRGISVLGTKKIIPSLEDCLIDIISRKRY